MKTKPMRVAPQNNDDDDYDDSKKNPSPLLDYKKEKTVSGIRRLFSNVKPPALPTLEKISPHHKMSARIKRATTDFVIKIQNLDNNTDDLYSESMVGGKNQERDSKAMKSRERFQILKSGQFSQKNLQWNRQSQGLQNCNQDLQLQMQGINNNGEQHSNPSSALLKNTNRQSTQFDEPLLTAKKSLHRQMTVDRMDSGRQHHLGSHENNFLMPNPKGQTQSSNALGTVNRRSFLRAQTMKQGTPKKDNRRNSKYKSMTIEELKQQILKEKEEKRRIQEEERMKLINDAYHTNKGEKVNNLNLDDSIIESDNCKENGKIFKTLSHDEKLQHLKDLWKKAYIKAKAGARILRFVNDLTKRICLYGVSNKLEDINQEEVIQPFIIQPTSKFKQYWNSVNVFLLIYTATYMPYKTAFLDTTTAFGTGVDWLVDVLFFMDIFVNFFSAFEEADGTLRHRFKDISLKYMKGWFLLDLIACIPFQLIGGSSQNELEGSTPKNYNKLLRLVRLPRLYRMVRIIRLLKMIKVAKQSKGFQKVLNKLKMNSAIIRMIQGMATSVLLTHLFACFWFLTAKFDDLQPETWVARRMLADSSPTTQYLHSMYWSTQTVVTVGYGDIPAQTSSEITISLFWMVFGVGFYSFIIGNFSSIISSNIQIQASIQSKIKSLAELTKKAQIPIELSRKIKKYIENNYEALYNQDDEANLVKMLPPSLRDEVLSNTYGQTIQNIRFFKELTDTDFLWKMLPVLRSMKLEKNDVLYWKGDHAEESNLLIFIQLILVYFIQKGNIKIYTDRGYPFAKYTEGDMFGDSDTLVNVKDIIVILYRQLQCPRDGKAIAITHLKMLVLDKIHFYKLSNVYQEVCFGMIMTAKKKRDLHYRLTIEADKKAIINNEMKIQESGYIDDASNQSQNNGKLTFMSTIRKRFEKIYKKGASQDNNMLTHQSTQNTFLHNNSLQGIQKWNSSIQLLSKRSQPKNEDSLFQMHSHSNHLFVKEKRESLKHMMSQQNLMKSDSIQHQQTFDRKQSFFHRENSSPLQHINDISKTSLQKMASQQQILPNLINLSPSKLAIKEPTFNHNNINQKTRSLSSQYNCQPSENAKLPTLQQYQSEKIIFSQNKESEVKPITPIKASSQTPISLVSFPKRQTRQTLLDQVMISIFGKKQYKHIQNQYPQIKTITRDKFELQNAQQRRDTVQSQEMQNQVLHRQSTLVEMSTSARMFCKSQKPSKEPQTPIIHKLKPITVFGQSYTTPHSASGNKSNRYTYSKFAKDSHRQMGSQESSRSQKTENLNNFGGNHLQITKNILKTPQLKPQQSLSSKNRSRRSKQQQYQSELSFDSLEEVKEDAKETERKETLIFKDKPTIIVNQKKGEANHCAYSKTPPIDSLMQFTQNYKDQEAKLDKSKLNLPGLTLGGLTPSPMRAQSQTIQNSNIFLYPDNKDMMNLQLQNSTSIPILQLSRKSSTTQKAIEQKFISLYSLKRYSSNERSPQKRKTNNSEQIDSRNDELQHQRSFSEAVAKVFQSHKKELSIVGQNQIVPQILLKRNSTNQSQGGQHLADLILGLQKQETFGNNLAIQQVMVEKANAIPNHQSTLFSEESNPSITRKQLINELRKKFKLTLEDEIKKMDSQQQNAESRCNTDRQSEQQHQYLDVKVQQKQGKQSARMKKTDKLKSTSSIIHSKSGEGIQFQGDPALINLVKLNCDMGLIGMNVFEIFTLFDMMSKGNQAINETLQNVQAQNNLIEMRQDNVEEKLDEIEKQLLRIKQLKENKMHYNLNNHKPMGY